MTSELRARPLSRTLELALAAARRAGVTRVGDVTAFAVPGIYVCQATRPISRTLSVSQGKGTTPTAAVVSAILEAVEFWSAEHVAPAGPEWRLSELAADEIATWAGEADPVRLRLDRDRPRHWVEGVELLSGRRCLAPWDLVALDFSRGQSECVSSSNGLATGNTRAEALASGVAELLEHHAIAAFDSVSPGERRRQQIALGSIEDPAIRRLLRRVSAAGFELRAWSMAGEAGLAVIQCTMFARAHLDEMLPVTGNGCHPDARVAFVRALLEAVQTQATLVAGARDDLTQDCYDEGRARLVELLLGAMAFGDGRLPWTSVPDARLPSSEACLDFLLGKAREQGARAVVAYHHDNGLEGLHIAHALAPGLLDDRRAVRQRRIEREGRGAATRPPAVASRGRRRDHRRILFAGPSVRGLAIPPAIELRPPAVWGDFAELLDSPPAAVALIDGCFKTAPTVWHREILGLIAAGTRVIGGASLGALRAAELDRFGMVGVGEIYAAYRAGALVRDDAVMLDHAPDALGHAPLTLALVDAENTLALADLPPRARRMMQRIVRTMPYERRDWPACLAQYRAHTGEDFPLTLDRLTAAPSLKQADALLVIEALASADGAHPPAEAAPAPAITSHYRAMLARRAPASLAGPV